MPIIEQHPVPHDRPSYKDDIPAPRPPSPERPTIEQPKINLGAQRSPAKIVLESETTLPKEVRPKCKPPARVDEPLRESEYDNITDDRQNPLIEVTTLRQLLELDEDEDRGFSKEMAREYFEQAEGKFNEMDKDFSSRNLLKLSSSGHFLKGSSAALGLSRVQSTCEMIQHCGAQRDEKLDRDLSEEDAVEIMGRLLKKVRLQYREAKRWLDDFFENDRELPDDDVLSFHSV